MVLDKKYYHNDLAEKALTVKCKPHGTQRQILKQSGPPGSFYSGGSGDNPG